MQIAIGSNQKRKYNYNREDLDQKKLFSEHNIYSCTGKKGTLVLFNAGRLYHRAAYRKHKRSVIQMNFTTGYGMWTKEEAISIPCSINYKYMKKSYSKISL